MEITKLSYNDLQFLQEVRNLFAEEFLHDSRKFTIQETTNWFIENSPAYWVIKVNGEKIGYFRTSNHSIVNKNIYIGADIHPNYQGKGYAQEAYKMFIPMIFAEYDLHKISLEVLATNQRAIHIYKKLGFVYEGTKRQEVLKNGKYVDSIIMSILRDEFKK